MAAPLALRVPDALAPLAPLVERARGYASNSHADETRRAYAGDVARFRAWCGEAKLEPLPAAPETVALYITHLAGQGRKASGIDRALAAIGQWHRAAGHDSPRSAPLVQRTRRGIRRSHGTAQTGKAPLLVDALRAAVLATPRTVAGARDRAVLLLGFAGAFRRSELVGLDVPDLRFLPRGVEVTIRRSKVDQEGAGRIVAIPRGAHPETCPVAALRNWIAASGRKTGPLFCGVSRWGKLSPRRLDGGTIARLLKRAAAVAGLDPAELAGHSLRAGLATTAALAGKEERAIMRTTGHSSERMVRRYIRAADRWIDNAAEDIGL